PCTCNSQTTVDQFYSSPFPELSCKSNNRTSIAPAIGRLLRQPTTTARESSPPKSSRFSGSQFCHYLPDSEPAASRTPADRRQTECCRRHPAPDIENSFLLRTLQYWRMGAASSELEN